MRHPLEGRYGFALAVAVLALAPYVVVTTAYVLYQKQLTADLGTGRGALEVIAGIATAGYAFGALLGGDLTNRFAARPLFFTAEAIFIIGSLLAASAGGTVQYGSGRVLQGFATGLLLVIALPPVIQRFAAERMPLTAAFVNIGFFGAATAGPLIGGAVAGAHAWRWFYGGLAALGAAVLLLAFLTLPDQEARNKQLSFDASGLLLGLAGAVLPFWAVGELTAHGFGSLLFILPLAIGLACLAALLLTEYHKEEPLSPVKLMWSTFPVVGTLVAMLGGGIYVTFVVLRVQFLLQVEHQAPAAAGLFFWPQLLGVIITAALLGLLLRTRYLPVLILAGMVTLLGGGVLLLSTDAHVISSVASLAAVGLLGLGAGATVSPGLYLAGFSVSSNILGRVFALVELVRSAADFLLAPVMVQVARVSSGGATLTDGGVRKALWIALAITVASIAGCLAVYLTGSRALPKPDIEAWLTRQQLAIDSPPLGARLKKA
ncbi:MAG TPA: MFS transporter [Steroidobacteraceae bacterium]|jgi:MFS family permease|nr:MFS transporter [Steroidobacteraceae bacterium]